MAAKICLLLRRYPSHALKCTRYIFICTAEPRRQHLGLDQWYAAWMDVQYQRYHFEPTLLLSGPHEVYSLPRTRTASARRHQHWEVVIEVWPKRKGTSKGTHWLNIRERIQFRISATVHRSLDWRKCICLSCVSRRKKTTNIVKTSTHSVRSFSVSGQVSGITYVT